MNGIDKKAARRSPFLRAKLYSTMVRRKRPTMFVVQLVRRVTHLP